MRLDTDRLVGKTASLTNAGLVLILLVTAMMVTWPRVTNALGMRHAPDPAYRAGQTIDTPADWYASSSYTLVVFARASCGACQTAQPFLKQLVADLGLEERGRARHDGQGTEGRSGLRPLSRPGRHVGQGRAGRLAGPRDADARARQRAGPGAGRVGRRRAREATAADQRSDSVDGVDAESSSFVPRSPADSAYP